MFKGLLLKESLHDERFLDEVRVSKIEIWDVENAADFQPDQWTAISFEGEPDQADLTAEKLSQAIKPAWYANFSSETHAYVVFAGRFFKYVKGDKQARVEAQQYALSVGVPEHQIDWGE